jgi:hypothetical protein
MALAVPLTPEAPAASKPATDAYVICHQDLQFNLHASTRWISCVEDLRRICCAHHVVKNKDWNVLLQQPSVTNTARHATHLWCTCRYKPTGHGMPTGPAHRCEPPQLSSSARCWLVATCLRVSRVTVNATNLVEPTATSICRYAYLQMATAVAAADTFACLAPQHSTADTSKLMATSLQHPPHPALRSTACKGWTVFAWPAAPRYMCTCANLIN